MKWKIATIRAQKMNARLSVQRCKGSPKRDSFFPKFKEMRWYIDYPNLLTPLQTLYFTNKLHRGKPPSDFNVDSIFYNDFSSNKPLAWGRRCRDWWRVFCNLYFIISFVNNLYSKFDNIPNFVFHCNKEKKSNSRISVSYFKYKKNKNKIFTFIFF